MLGLFEEILKLKLNVIINMILCLPGGSPINGLFVLVMLMTLALLTSQRKQVVVLT